MCLSKIIFYADLSFDLKCNSKEKLCFWLSVLVRMLAFSSTLVCTPARGLQLQAISWFSWPTSAFCSSSHRRTAWFCLTTVQMQWGISSVSCMAPLTGIVYIHVCVWFRSKYETLVSHWENKSTKNWRVCKKSWEWCHIQWVMQQVGQDKSLFHVHL